MQGSFILLCCELFSAWSGIFGEVDWLDDVRLLCAASSLVLAGRALTSRDYTHLFRTLKIALLANGLAILWVVFQLAPWTLASNPIWDSARAALDVPMAGHVSIDPTATLSWLSSAILAASVMLASAATSLNRYRAERLLLLLCLIVDGGVALAAIPGLADRKNDADLAASGLILSLGCGYFIYERFETRFAHAAHRSVKLATTETLLLIAAMGCLLRLVALDACGLLIGIAAGVGLMAALVLMRRTGISLFQAFVLAAFLLVGAVMSLAVVRSNGPLAVAFTTASPHVRDATSRMVEDAPLAGTGAGTFDVLSPLYAVGQDDRAFHSASTAARLQIELGWPASALTASLLGVLVLALIRGALIRGRDSTYPFIGGALVTTFIVGGFCGDEIEGHAWLVSISALLGLALVQSERQTD